MPVCDGRPGIPCPDKRKDCSVRLSQGDLMLCPACEAFRFPYHKSIQPPSEVLHLASNSVGHGDIIQPPLGPNELKTQTIICELLFFIMNVIDQHPVMIVKQIINDFYRDDEIINAKQTLIQATSDTVKNLSIQSCLKKRIGDNKARASTDDILAIVLAIDENCLRDSIPVFCAANLSRLPVIPDEMSDISALRSEVKQLRQMAEMSDLTSMKSEVGQLRQLVEGLVSKFTPQNLSSVLSHALPSLDADMVVDKGTQSTSILGVNKDAVDEAPVFNKEPAGTVNETFADIVKLNADDFQLVTKKPRPKKKITVGESTSSSGFSGVAKRAVVCVSRMEPDTSVEVVSVYLASKGINVLTCYLLKPPENARFASMRLCVPQNDVKKLFESHLWPYGVVVRPWTFKSKQ